MPRATAGPSARWPAAAGRAPCPCPSDQSPVGQGLGRDGVRPRSGPGKMAGSGSPDHHPERGNQGSQTANQRAGTSSSRGSPLARSSMAGWVCLSFRPGRAPSPHSLIESTSTRAPIQSNRSLQSPVRFPRASAGRSAVFRCPARPPSPDRSALPASPGQRPHPGGSS